MSDEYSLLNDPEMKEIFESFIVETREILDSLDLDLVDLENQPDQTDKRIERWVKQLKEAFG